MGKKPKEPHKTNGVSNIFKTLFGDIPQQAPPFSIFSDTNPFKRKPFDPSQPPQQQQQQEQTHLETNDGEVKKRKRKKDKTPNTHLDAFLEDSSETHLETKKSKKKSEPKSPDLDTKSKEGNLETKKSKKKSEPQSSDFGITSKEGNLGNSSNLGVEMSPNVKEEKKKKKKRKRDEVEAEYEAKRYGAQEESGEGQLVVGEKRKKLYNPEDMLVSKEGFDDEDKLLRTIFVGNLPLKVKKKALLREFSQFGEVESVRIRSVPIVNSKTPRKGAIIKKQINDSVDSVNAYIVFKTEESAQASLSHNMAVVLGNHIRVDRACPPRKKLKADNDAQLYDNKRTVFVGNLPFDVKDEEIYQLFSGMKNLESSVEAVRVIRDPSTSVGKGIAYVLLKTRDAANLVLRRRNIKIRDRELRLSHSKPNSTPSKRENSSSGERNNYPAKKLATGSRSPYSNGNSQPKANISYQGVRATKSGGQKKFSTKISEPARLKSMAQKLQKPKSRSGKRPSVAARRTNVVKGGDGKQAGGKRKMESRTPESGGRNKKARKFR